MVLWYECDLAGTNKSFQCYVLYFTSTNWSPLIPDSFAPPVTSLPFSPTLCLQLVPVLHAEDGWPRANQVLYYKTGPNLPVHFDTATFQHVRLGAREQDHNTAAQNSAPKKRAVKGYATCFTAEHICARWCSSKRCPYTPKGVFPEMRKKYFVSCYYLLYTIIIKSCRGQYVRRIAQNIPRFTHPNILQPETWVH